ncbi:hypothetical protein BX070DRAFT_227986 [Coemansia spiralis]|nr:hypothetical protein BX070DRAFT_227986 [Coemansia spiralis]
MALKAELEQWHQAVEFFDQQDYDSALDVFSTIADSAKIHFNIGLILGRKGDHNAAIDAYSKALELDQYLVVAYFQRGVAKMVLQRNDESLEDFNNALKYLRDNPFIDYTQLGLDYKVYTCEVLYNRALCFFCLGQENHAHADLADASKHIKEERHSWVKKAIESKGMDCPLYCVPKGVIYRPSASKLKSTKKIDFLGSAKVIASADGKDNFTGFKGALVRKETLKNMAAMSHQKSMRVRRSSPSPEMAIGSGLSRSNTMPIHRNEQSTPTGPSPLAGNSQGGIGNYSQSSGTSRMAAGLRAEPSTLVKMQSTSALASSTSTAGGRFNQQPHHNNQQDALYRDNESDGGASTSSSPEATPATLHSDSTSPDVLSPIAPKSAMKKSPGASASPRGPVDPLDIIRAGLARRATLKNQQQGQPQQGSRPGIPQRSVTMKVPTRGDEYSDEDSRDTAAMASGSNGVRRNNTTVSSGLSGHADISRIDDRFHGELESPFADRSPPLPSGAQIARTEIIAPVVQRSHTELQVHQDISAGHSASMSPEYYASNDESSHHSQLQQPVPTYGSSSLPQHPGVAHAQSSLNPVMMTPPLSHEEIAAARGIAGIGLNNNMHAGTYRSSSSLSPSSSMASPISASHYSSLNGAPMSAGSGILRRAPTKKDAMKVKVHYGQDIVNLMVPKHATFDTLRLKVEAKLISSNPSDGEGRSSGALRIRYLDEDGEAVLMTDEDDYELAKAYAGGDMSSPETNIVERLELWCSF